MKAKGLGDTISEIIDFAGIKKLSDCGCKERQEWFNKKIPYKK